MAARIFVGVESATELDELKNVTSSSGVRMQLLLAGESFRLRTSDI
jgi:hypothetical protein